VDAAIQSSLRNSISLFRPADQKERVCGNLHVFVAGIENRLILQADLGPQKGSGGGKRINAMGARETRKKKKEGQNGCGGEGKKGRGG